MLGVGGKPFSASGASDPTFTVATCAEAGPEMATVTLLPSPASAGMTSRL